MLHFFAYPVGNQLNFFHKNMNLTFNFFRFKNCKTIFYFQIRFSSGINYLLKNNFFALRVKVIPKVHFFKNSFNDFPMIFWLIFAVTWIPFFRAKRGSEIIEMNLRILLSCSIAVLCQNTLQFQSFQFGWHDS